MHPPQTKVHSLLWRADNGITAIVFPSLGNSIITINQHGFDGCPSETAVIRIRSVENRTQFRLFLGEQGLIQVFFRDGQISCADKGQIQFDKSLFTRPRT